MSAARTFSLLLVSAFVVTAGCVAPARGDLDRVRAVATISIIADFVREVGGEAVTVDSIVPVGGDPHVHEPTPSDARLAADADIVFRNGFGLERWLDRIIGRGRADRPVVTVTEGLQARVHLEGDFAGDPDPHLWMDPSLAVTYVTAIRDALVSFHPDEADGYRARSAAYVEELRALDRWIAEQIATIPAENRKLVTTHDAFRYFGDRYGLEVVGTIWSISTEREPSAAEIAALIDAIRVSGVPIVFVETTIDPRVMQRVARDADVAVGAPLYGDSVGEPGSGAESYIGMMRANTRAIVEGLGGAVTR